MLFDWIQSTRGVVTTLKLHKVTLLDVLLANKPLINIVPLVEALLSVSLVGLEVAIDEQQVFVFYFQTN